MVLTYFYRRDQKEQKKKTEEKVKQLENKTDRGIGYAIVIKENGSVQVLFEDGKVAQKPASGRTEDFVSYRRTMEKGENFDIKNKGTKDFVDRRQMIKFLGKTITCDLPGIIPEEKGTYVLILYIWKNQLIPIKGLELTEPPQSASYKFCKACETQNDSDAVYCKNCGEKLHYC